MAYLVDFTVQESTAGATSVPVTLPAHQANDILVVYWTQDATATVSMTNWTQIGTTQSAGTAITSAAFWRRALGSTETGTLTISAADAYTIKAFCIRDVDTTTAIDTSSTTNTNTALSQFNSDAITPTTNDTFILYLHGLDGIAVATHSDPGVHFIQSSDSTGATATTSAASGCAWYIHRTGGTAAPTPSWRTSLAGVRTNITVAFRNATNGVIPAYLDDIDKPVALVAGHHFSTLNGISFPGALTLANIGPGGTGLATAFDAAAAVADFGINPYSSALSSTPAITAAGTVRGFEVTFNPTIDMSTGFVMGTVIASTPRQANYDHGSIAQGGTFIAFGSGATANTNYRSYKVLARNSIPNTEGRSVFSINPNQTVTAFGTNGTLNTTAVNKMLFLSNNPTAAITLYTTDWCLINKIVVAGGSTAVPVDTSGLVDVGSSFRIKTIQPLGASGILSYVPLQIGGNDQVIFDIEGGSLQFPRIYDTVEREINFHAALDTIGISYAGKSGDTIRHTNSVVSSPSEYYWEINTSATSAATWDFRGLVVIGANVTLRNVMTFDLMTFNSFTVVEASGCTVTNCTFSEPPATTNSILVNGSTSFNSCSFDTTTITAGNSLTSTANPSIFVDCSFTGSSTSGHAIRITSPGTYSFSGNLFSGYAGTPGDNLTPNSGSTSAAIFNDSGGLVTLNIAGGGTIPTIRNGAGATTDISAAANVTLTGLKADSEVRAYLGTNPATATELAGTESSGTSFTFSQSAGGQAGYIQIFHVEYQPVFLEVTYGTSNVDIPIQQIFDRQYARGTIFTPG